MSKRVKVHVGTREDMGKRFVSAWHRLEHHGERRFPPAVTSVNQQRPDP